MTSDDDTMDNTSNTDEKNARRKDDPASCRNVSDYIFQEKDELVRVEFEDADFTCKGYMI